ncbi:MAG: hydrogenase [Oscillospiraceae bacterium]|nr:hydrogenase [Oscillospiraceae bacterium]
MSDFSNILSTLILLSAVLLMACKRANSYIKSLRLQSSLIALAAGVMGTENMLKDGQIELLFVCIITIIFKVIFIPNLLMKTEAKVEHKVEKDFILNIPILVIICCALIVFIYVSTSNIDGLNEGSANMQLVNSISIILIGLLFMISRKRAIGQIIGFLVIENGLFVTAMFVTNGMPFVVDMGILIDLLTAVIIMGVMVFKINDKFDSINIDKLRNLKG